MRSVPYCKYVRPITQTATEPEFGTNPMILCLVFRDAEMQCALGVDGDVGWIKPVARAAPVAWPLANDPVIPTEVNHDWLDNRQRRTCTLHNCHSRYVIAY